MQTEEMRLDGNAAAGTLREVFARDVTAALARCSGCGATGPIGALLDYGHAMGVVLRCPSCDTAVLRIARTPGWIRVDAAGMAFLTIPENPTVT
ncbi:MAG TPA: DUF6510 family protein [Gemmatimonadaceae bacterium]|nr:DUF6510 family protein [Gemmatimonadaceae bacterium]